MCSVHHFQLFFLLSANWIAFTDRQSGIFAYTWCLGTFLGSCDLLAPVDPHAELGLASPQSWTNTGLATFRNLSDGSYYLSVQAVSNVEYGGPLATTVQHSTPYVLDTSLPVLGAIEGLEYNATSDLLSFSYNARYVLLFFVCCLFVCLFIVVFCSLLLY